MAIIAIDYDETLVFQDFPHPGTIKPDAAKYINLLYDQGHRIIINTCRVGESMEVAKKYLLEHGVKFDKINENLDYIIAIYGRDTRKISADIYIDDKQLGGLPDSWEEIYNITVKQIK